MYDTELETFIKKFKSLWYSGLDAHLDVETHVGQAWVSLRVQLGQAPGPLHYQVKPQFPHHKPRKSPSRERRQARRAAARQKTAEEASNEVSV